MSPSSSAHAAFGGGDAGVGLDARHRARNRAGRGPEVKLALVRSEQDKDYLKRPATVKDAITPLNPAPPIQRGDHRQERAHRRHDGHDRLRRRSSRVRRWFPPACLGHRAVLHRPADDGCRRRSAWHAAKILKCGTACRGDSASAPTASWPGFATTIRCRTQDMEVRCSAQSVASQRSTRTADPFLITEPDGTLDSHGSRYEALNDRRGARSTGRSSTRPKRTTIKARKAPRWRAYQAIIIGGVREPSSSASSIPGLPGCRSNSPRGCRNVRRTPRAERLRYSRPRLWPRWRDGRLSLTQTRWDTRSRCCSRSRTAEEATTDRDRENLRAPFALPTRSRSGAA